MEVSKGYKQTEVGLVPDDWDVRRIGSVCRLINGRGFKPFEWRESGFPIIRIQNLNGSDDFNYYSGPYDTKLEVKSGQLLFAWSGSRGTSFGPHIWRGPMGLLNYHTWKIQIFESEVQKSFFLHALRQLTAYIEGKAHGASALVHTQKWEMEGFLLPLPSTLTEQEAIANTLSDADALIESLVQLIAKKRQIKQGAMQELLTGKRRLRGFNEEWVVKRFEELFTTLRCASNSRSELNENGEVAYVHYGDIHTHPSAFLNPITLSTYISKVKVRTIHRLVDGDLLMADASEDTTAIGKAVEIQGLKKSEAVAGLHTMVLRGNKKYLADGFKGYLQFLPDVRTALVRLATGVSVYGITKSGVKEIEVKLPAPSEQSAIAMILSDMDSEITELETKLTKTCKVKQGLMQKLLTGRIRLV